MSLSQAGIGSISLQDTVEPQLQNGNLILERSLVTMSDGRTLEMADVSSKPMRRKRLRLALVPASASKWCCPACQPAPC